MMPLCVRIDADDTRSADALRVDGWRDVEVLETWRTTAPYSGFVGQHIRSATLRDNLPCQLIAQKAFVHDRLHRDCAVEKDEADAAKREWVNKGFAANLQNILVHDPDGEVRGFIAVKPETIVLIVDLIAVDPDHHGKGIGKSLIRAVQARYPQQQMVQAGTQEHNEPGRRMYSSLGFVLTKRQRTLHK